MDLIRIGLQNLDDARANLDRLKADGVSDERLVGMLKALSKVCDPDCASSCDSVQNSWRPQPTMPAKATFTITNSAERMCSNR